MSAKSLWNIITNRAIPAAPASTALFPFAAQPGTRLVTQANAATLAQITAAAVALGPVQVATVQFNDAAIKALPTTTPQLVPGVLGKVILPMWVSYILTPWVADYTNIDGASKFAVNVAGNPYTNPVFGAGAILAQGAATVIWTDVGREFDYTPLPFASLVNEALLLTVTNAAAGDFTGGDATQVLTVQVLYELI